MRDDIARALDGLAASVAANPNPAPDKEKRRRASIEADRKREDKPRSAPIPTGRERVLAESGGTYLGTKYRLTICALQDPRLKDAAKVLTGAFLWRLQSGRVYKRPLKRLAADVQIPYRTAKRAMGQMKAAGYLRRFLEGWICPALEVQVPEEHRACREQMAFEFARGWDRLNAAKHLRLVEPEGPPVAPGPEKAGGHHGPMRGHQWPHEGPLVAPATHPNPSEHLKKNPACRNGQADAPQGEMFGFGPVPSSADASRPSARSTE